MKFSILTAHIYIVRQIAYKIVINYPTTKTFIKEFFIYTNYYGFKAQMQKLLHQLLGWYFPQWKYTTDICFLQFLFPIQLKVFEENVAEYCMCVAFFFQRRYI